MVCKGQSRKQECRSVPISFLFLIVRVIAKKQDAAFRDIDPSWDVSQFYVRQLMHQVASTTSKSVCRI